MSANLLAEFEEFYQPKPPPAPLERQQQQQHRPPQISVTGSNAAPSNNHSDAPQDDADDDFGDFETATPAPVTPTLPTHPTTTSSPRTPKDKPLPARPKPDPPLEKPLPKPRNLDVLFDAEDDSQDDDDDFGEFEEVFSPPATALTHGRPLPHKPSSPAPAAVPPQQQQSLIDFDDAPSASSQPEATPSQPNLQAFALINPQPAPVSVTLKQANNDFGDLLGLDPPAEAVPAKQQTPGSKPPAESPHEEQEQEAEWDDFEAAETPVASPLAAANPTTSPIKPLALSSLLLSFNPADTELPPTNIPPPAILLTVFPNMVAQAQSEFYGPLSQYNDQPEVRDGVLKLPQTRKYLSDMIESGVVLARVIAGRKNRWKRDKILAQSMSIGQAGRSGGMKLTGVDKAENAREEREVADAVASWQSQLGKLKTAVNTSGKLGSVSDIAENYTVRLAPASEGALNSPKACIVCGLKRNERVAKVDVDVQDSFGEWWIEHFGHNQCIRLWYAQKDALKSR